MAPPPPFMPGIMLIVAIFASQVWSSVAFTQSSAVGSISPVSISVSHATVITFSGGSAGPGDQALFIASGGACPATAAFDAECTGSTCTLDGSSQLTVTLGSIATAMILCYRTNLQIDTPIAQSTAPINLNVIAATSNNKFSSVSPTGIYVSIATQLTISGGTAVTGDKADWCADCSLCTPTTALAAGSPSVTTFTVGSTGTGLRLCVRDVGGSDSVGQDNILLSVSAIGGVGSDPVTWYGDKVHVFSLPPRTLKPLLSATDMTLHGETFSHGGPWQQWFDRMVLASPDGSRWVQISVRKDILEFNRSRAPKGHFETLEVTLGHGSFDNPSVRTVVPGPDLHIPANFLGFDVIFWKMNRNARAANSMIGSAHRECMEVAGANVHFYVCSSPAHEFYGWQRDLAVKNAHLDLAIIEVIDGHELKGILPELWGMQPMSKETEEYVVKDESTLPLPSAQDRVAQERVVQWPFPTLPKSALATGKGWAGGFGFKDLDNSCKQGNHTVLACDANASDNQTILTV